MALKDYINAWQNAQRNIERFHGKQMPQDPDEESLFNAMIDYFNSQPYATVVTGADKTHHHNVNYAPFPPYNNMPLWGPSVTKEISDVFIIVFSRRRDIARMTHLQAKLEKANGLDRNAGSFVFKLDAGQYLMLHNRLPIHDTTGLYSDDAFSCPLYSDSIASYGVFYKDGNDYNMAYEIASLIYHSTPIIYTSKDQKENHNFATIQNLWGYFNVKYPGVPLFYLHPRHYFRELVSTIDIQTFERELYRVRVGAQVEFDIRMLKKIASIFATKGYDLRGFDAFIQGQESLYGDGPFGDRNNRDGGNEYPVEFNYEDIGGTYILINADMANNRE